MNYMDFFNLAEEPFSYLKTNPRYFYNAPQYRYAKAILNDGIMNKSAHLYLTGPRGSGKTTLLRVLEVDLQDDDNNLVYFTFAVKDLRSAYSFTRRLCKEMGIKFIACTQSMEFMELTKEDLLPVVDSVAGVATFLADAEDSKINLLI